MAGAGYKFSWNGNEVAAGLNRAVERTLVGTSENTASIAKQTVHRVSGTLSRSIHTAAPGYDDGDGDLINARGSYIQRNRQFRRHGGTGPGLQKVMNADGNYNYVEFTGGSDIENDSNVVWDGGTAEIWVGSWIIYAFIEEVVRGHAYMAPAVSAAVADFGSLLARAIQEELAA